MLKLRHLFISKTVHTLFGQELFDLVVGVSTGSILAAMSAIYDCPLDDCEKLYKSISVEVFKRNVIAGASKLVVNHSYYDTDYWNDLLQRYFSFGLFWALFV